MKPIRVLELWALERRSRWLADIDFQDNMAWGFDGPGSVYERADIIWVGCVGIAFVTGQKVCFNMRLDRTPMDGEGYISDPKFFDWLNEKFVEAGIFKY